MATTTIETEPRLAPSVRSAFDSLRARIRCYVWFEGSGMALAWLGLAFWVSLGVDWLFEPPVAMRAVMLAAAALVLLGIAVRLIGRRAFVPLTDSNMATVLERRFSQFDDSLLTAVVLTDGRHDLSRLNPEMLARTCREAEERIGGVRLREVFNPVPRNRSLAAAAVLAASVVAFGFRAPEAMGVWAARCLGLSQELWPRKTRLTVEGFNEENNYTRKVARGADLEVIARADLSAELVPRTAEVRYRNEGGSRGRATMDRLGEAELGKDEFQRYSYTFQGILTSVDFDVKGGDCTVRDLRIQVVESPTVTEMRLHLKLPEYTGRPERELPVTGVMQIPEGTDVTVLARANKELTGVKVDVESSSRWQNVIEADQLAEDRMGFELLVPSLREDAVLSFTLSDTDGITAAEPVRLSLVVVPDEPPQMEVRLSGIDKAITPFARLPLAGRITDDYGLSRAWFEHAAEGQEPGTTPIDLPWGSPTELPLKDLAALEVEPLGLEPGQKLFVGVKAADRYQLDEEDEPHVGASERWLLDVVTPDQLRAMLEARELVLRQRFERIIQEVTETRDLLARIKLGEELDTPEEKEEDPGEGAEPEDELGAEAPEGDNARSRELTLSNLRVQRAVTNTRKSTHETLSVAESFDDIRLQLINNRIDTEELNRRLSEGIADPLRRIAGEMFPELERRLERLEAALEDAQLGPKARDEARRQADEILIEMQKVLDRMLELEDFNEALELLRAIIKLQEELEGQTRERQKQKIRELLEED